MPPGWAGAAAIAPTFSVAVANKALETRGRGEGGGTAVLAIDAQQSQDALQSEGQGQLLPISVEGLGCAPARTSEG